MQKNSGRNAERRRTVVKAVGTESPRSSMTLREHSTCWLSKNVVRSFKEAGKFRENWPCEEETDELDDQSDEEEEEEHCLPLEEAVAASWIEQIGK